MSDIATLAALLEDERAAILSGTFDEVTRLSTQKESLLEKVGRQSATLPELRGIAASVSRNQTLLASAIDGVRAVSARLGDLRRARDGFETYGPAGDRSRVGTAKPAFQSKL